MGGQTDVRIQCQTRISVKPVLCAYCCHLQKDGALETPPAPSHAHQDTASGRRSHLGCGLPLRPPGCRPGASLVPFPEVGQEPGALEKLVPCQAPQHCSRLWCQPDLAWRNQGGGGEQRHRPWV